MNSARRIPALPDRTTQSLLVGSYYPVHTTQSVVLIPYHTVLTNWSTPLNLSYLALEIQSGNRLPLSLVLFQQLVTTTDNTFSIQFQRLKRRRDINFLFHMIFHLTVQKYEYFYGTPNP